MKKILIALAMTGLTYCGAEAQTAKTTEVCRRTVKGTACYQTKYAQNFKVCKDDEYGYHICGEQPTEYNTTEQPVPYVSTTPVQQYPMTTAVAATPPQMVAPQSQSYPWTADEMNVNTESTYTGYYPKRNRIKVFYDNGNSVADMSRAPYEGEPSPQYDGPEKNIQRNINGPAK